MTLYVCSLCDFHFIDALDTYPDDQPEPVLTDKARTYIEQQLPRNREQLQRDLQFIQSHTDLTGAQCLDIGAGAGQFADLLRDAGGSPFGIEPQQVFREFALEKYQFNCKSDLIDAPYWQQGYAGHFDLITLWDTLEHVNDPVTTLTSAVHLLKPGGYLFLDTPSRDSFFYRASEWSYRLSNGSKPALLNKLYSPKPYRHKQIFTEGQLLALLDRVGLSFLEFSPIHRSKNKFVVACRK